MVELAVRLVVSLTVVVGLLLLLARLSQRRFAGAGDALVKVVHRRPLSRTSAVAVVTVGGRVLVLGTTDQQVSVLAELDPAALERAVPAAVDETLVAPVATTLASPALALVGEGPVSPSGGKHRAATPTAPEPVDLPSELAGASGGALTGSVLSPQTWRQAFAAASRSSGKAREVS